MKKPFTLFMIILIIAFLLYWPHYMYLFETGKIKTEPLEEQGYRGIITLWDFPHPSINDPDGFNFIKKKIQDFEYNHPGVIIEFEPLQYKDGFDKINKLLSDSTRPDIIPIAADNPNIYEGKLEPLNKYLDRNYEDMLKERVINTFTYKGNIYGLPLGMYTNVLFLNLDMFSKREVEIPENGEWTYDKFVEDMMKLTYHAGRKDKINYYGLSTYIDDNNYNVWGFLMSDGANIVDDKGKISFDGPQALSGIQKLVDLNKKGVLNPVSFEGDYNKVWDSFATLKESAVLVDKSYKIANLKYLQSRNKLFEFDVALYPEGDGDIPFTISSKVYGYGITKQSDKKKLELAYKFIKFITDSQKDVEDMGYIPVKKGISVSDEYMKRIEKAINYTNYVPENWQDKNIKINNTIHEGLKNNDSADAILKKINDIIHQ